MPPVLTSISKSRLRWVLPALLLLNLGLKLFWCGVNELAGDEPFTVYWAQRPLAELFSMLRTENNPPLYFLLLHYWSLWVPLEPGWLRVPSAVFSALTVWPLYLIGKRLGGTVTGITAALLFTFSQHSFHFAHEVRAYSLLVLACTWAVWQLVRLADGPGHPALRPTSIGWLVVANTVATWTHYFGWVMVGLELVLVFSLVSLRPVRAKMLVAAALTTLLNLPLMGVLLSRAGASLGQGTWVDPPSWEEPYNMVMRWSNAPVVAVIFLALLVLAFAKPRKGSTSMALAGLWCGLPLVGLFLISFVFPVYIGRYLLFASPGFYLLVAQAASRPALGKMPAWLLPVGCVLAMAVTFIPWKPGKSHPSRVVKQVEAWRNDHTAVIIQPGWYGLTYAWAVSPAYFKGAAPVELSLRERGIHPLPGKSLPNLDSSITRVIHIDAWASLTDPDHAVLNDLRFRFRQTDSVEADRKVVVRRFQRP